jgi:hypothetical protein
MAENDKSYQVILTSFEDEYDETNDPVWVWHAIDFCSNWHRKTGQLIAYPQWVTDYLSGAAEAVLKLDDDDDDLGSRVAAIIGVNRHSISKSVETIRDKLIYFEIQSAINHGSEHRAAIAEVARTFSLPEETVKAIYQRFNR